MLANGGGGRVHEGPCALHGLVAVLGGAGDSQGAALNGSDVRRRQGGGGLRLGRDGEGFHSSTAVETSTGDGNGGRTNFGIVAVGHRVVRAGPQRGAVKRHSDSWFQSGTGVLHRRGRYRNNSGADVRRLVSAGGVRPFRCIRTLFRAVSDIKSGFLLAYAVVKSVCCRMMLNKCDAIIHYLLIIYQQIWIIVIIAHIIPCHIYAIPDAIVHLDIVPCMVGIGIVADITKGIHTGDAQFITEDMERLCITLADRANCAAASPQSADALPRCFRCSRVIRIRVCICYDTIVHIVLCQPEIQPFYLVVSGCTLNRANNVLHKAVSLSNCCFDGCLCVEISALVSVAICIILGFVIQKLNGRFRRMAARCKKELRGREDLFIFRNSTDALIAIFVIQQRKIVPLPTIAY